LLVNNFSSKPFGKQIVGFALKGELLPGGGQMWSREYLKDGSKP